MKAKRLEFAKPQKYWSKVLFSDESTIQLFATRKQNFVDYQEKDTTKNTRFQP